MNSTEGSPTAIHCSLQSPLPLKLCKASGFCVLLFYLWNCIHPQDFCMLHKYHCFLILPLFVGVRGLCTGLVTFYIEEGQNPGAYDTQETLLLFLLCIDPHTLQLPVTMPVILIVKCSLQLYHFSTLSLLSSQSFRFIKGQGGEFIYLG